ncbi:MAG: hypothetical protein DMF63_02050 [Acidobacteria bacterium]|nr:MAG: hypothetical protein DMF63_02050 [Acidobacteriota bacterium]
MINRYVTSFLGCLLLTFLFTAFATAQRTIPFRIAFDDPAAKFSSSKWPVLGRFEGTVEISNDGEKNILKVKLTGGELIAGKDPRIVLAITPFLAKPWGEKNFKRAEMAEQTALLHTTLDVGVPLKLEPFESVIELSKGKDLSKYWLAFQVRLECPYAGCYVYAHSPGDIFAK